MLFLRKVIACTVVVFATVLKFGEGQLEQIELAVEGILDSVLHPRPIGFGMGLREPPRPAPRFNDYGEGGPEWGPEGSRRGPWGGHGGGGRGPWGGRGGGGRGPWGGHGGGGRGPWGHSGDGGGTWSGQNGGGPWGQGQWNGGDQWSGNSGSWSDPNGWNGPTGSGVAVGSVSQSSQQPQPLIPSSHTSGLVPPNQSFPDVDTTGARTFANNVNSVQAPVPVPGTTRAPVPTLPPRTIHGPAATTAAPIRQPGTSGGLFGDPNNQPMTLRGPPSFQ